MIKPFYSMLLIVLLFIGGKSANKDSQDFSDFQNYFIKSYNDLNIPGIQYDYKAYFNEIPGSDQLNKQKTFFNEALSKIKAINRQELKPEAQVIYDQLAYEIDFNLERIDLELNWVLKGREVPVNGLHGLNEYGRWYSYFIKKYTSLNLSPVDIMEMGKREVRMVQTEIKKIQQASSYTDSTSFYKYLQTSSFYITDKNLLIREFEKTDSIVRSKIESFIDNVQIPEVYAMEWENSGPNTPPGMYMNHSYNSYGKDVFQFNFFGEKYNRRAIEWLYMHEAIPGHHLQFSLREGANVNPVQELFSYSGNFEGWGCYVEYHGKELGLYKDIYSYLGKWEWDLVRSVRLVLDAGIHNYGWTRKQALDYWKESIIGQDDIAEREITRVTNWPAQAISYKAGADCISTLRENAIRDNANSFDQSRFNHTYLSFGMCPLEVIKKNFQSRYVALK